MATIDYGYGEREYRCTARTLVIYEQAFYNDNAARISGDLIADFFGKQRITEDSLGLVFDDDGNIEAIVADYTATNWGAVLRALWAMLKTQGEIDTKAGNKAKPLPAFESWSRETIIEWEPDMKAVSNEVAAELNRGLFRAGAAASE